MALVACSWVKRRATKVRPSMNRKAIRPPVTCRPWKPVVRKNTEP